MSICQSEIIIIINFEMVILCKNNFDIIWYSVIFAANLYFSIFVWSSDNLNLWMLSFLFKRIHSVHGIKVEQNSTYDKQLLKWKIVTIQLSYAEPNTQVERNKTYPDAVWWLLPLVWRKSGQHVDDQRYKYKHQDGIHIYLKIYLYI